MNIFSDLLLTILIVIFIPAYGLYCQCNLNPVIEGDMGVCPYDSTANLFTQQFDSYQWYYRDYQDSVAEAVQGATDRTIQFNVPEQTGYYSVEVTEDTCVERSSEFEVSVIGFIPPEISWSQEVFFENGNLYLCEEDSATLGYTYNHNIIWFRNGDTIQVDERVLEIKEGGLYTAQASPVECPELIFTHPEVEILDTTCVTSTSTYNKIKITVYPNPANDFLLLNYDQQKLSSAVHVTIFDTNGRKQVQRRLQHPNQKMDISTLPHGIYVLQITSKGENIAFEKFVK